MTTIIEQLLEARQEDMMPAEARPVTEQSGWDTAPATQVEHHQLFDDVQPEPYAEYLQVATEETITAAQQGDREAMSELCAAYLPYVRNRALQMHNGNWTAAEDTVQNALEKVIRKIGSFSVEAGARDDGSVDCSRQFTGWVRMVTTRTALDSKKRDSRSVPSDGSEVIQVPGTDDKRPLFEQSYFGQLPESPEEIVCSRTKSWAADAINTIQNKDFRAALDAVYVRGLTPEEYAAEAGIKPATVRTRLHRGINLIRERIGDRTIQTEDPRADKYINGRAA